jgi:hypothetical protein
MASCTKSISENKLDRFHSLEVRPIIAAEREQWDGLMTRYHYLGNSRIAGKGLRYVAMLEGRWVALVGWGAAALKNRHRDAWIGWRPELKWQRLKFLANNVRYLILPAGRIPHLASKILSANLKRLSRDWEQAHGHPILLVETFVDTGRFAGTCYKAAGWIALGQTRGYRRSGRTYYHHGNAKTLFIRPLHRRAARLLSDPWSNLARFQEGGMGDISSVKIEGKGGLWECLKRVPDPRKARGIRHKKLSVLAIAICAILSGCKSFAAIWEWAERCNQSMLKRLWCRRDPQRKHHVPPSEPTIRRMLQQIDAAAVDKEVMTWLRAQAKDSLEGIVAVDGKTLKASRARGGKPVHLLSAFLQQQRIVIAQQAVDGKSNEITALAPMLEDVDIEGMVVTTDALHTQKESARFIVEKKCADYFFTVKDNQATLKDDIKSLHMEAFPPSG